MFERLPDNFYTSNEIVLLDRELLDSHVYSTDKPVQKNICVYEFWVAKGNTNVVTILATEDPTSTEEALCRDWAHTKLTPVLSQISDLEWNTDTKLQAIYTVLNKHKYATDIKAQTSDRLFKWQSWMRNIL